MTAHLARRVPLVLLELRVLKVRREMSVLLDRPAQWDLRGRKVLLARMEMTARLARKVPPVLQVRRVRRAMLARRVRSD
jgi:hypothetical protein